jgi:hypothetical protein
MKASAPIRDAGAASGQGLAQTLLHRAQEEVQRQGLNGGIVLQEVAHAFRHRQHPLAHRQARHDVIGEVGGGFHHAPRVAGRTHTPALARIGGQEVVAALSAPRTGETMGEDAAFPRRIAVGMPVTRHPPHRSERARFGHSAPTSGV